MSSNINIMCHSTDAMQPVQHIVLSLLDSYEAPACVNVVVLLRKPVGCGGILSCRDMPEVCCSLSASLVCDSVIHEAMQDTKNLLMSKQVVTLSSLPQLPPLSYPLIQLHPSLPIDSNVAPYPN